MLPLCNFGVGCIGCWRASPETKQSDVVFVDRDEDVTSAVIGWNRRTRFCVALTDTQPILYYDKTPDTAVSVRTLRLLASASLHGFESSSGA
jgi:hypothetical protein